MREVVMQTSHHGNHESALAATPRRPTLAILKPQPFFIDLTQCPLRTFHVRLGNHEVLVPMPDKVGATFTGKNGEYADYVSFGGRA
jgi:hypothetical protein